MNAEPNIEKAAPVAIRKDFLTRCWNGEARLWQAFWLVGVLGKVLFLVAVAFVGFWFQSASGSVLVAVSFMVPAIIIFVVFASVSVWRCAPNVKIEPLGALAKVGVIFYVMFMIFLFLRVVLNAF